MARVCEHNGQSARRRDLMPVGLEIEINRMGFNWDLHAISLGDCADVEGSSDGTGDRGLLFVICKAFSGVVGAAALGDLKNDRRFDITGRAQIFTRPELRESSKNQTHRAASRTAFAVEEEVTFCDG